MRGRQRLSSVVGLDIGRDAIKVAQVSLRDKGPRLDGCIKLTRSQAGYALTSDEAKQLLRVMDRYGLSASRTVLVAPADALVGGSMSVPPADKGASRDKIVALELSRAHKLSLGSFEMAWWDLPASSAGARVGQAHALALPHSAVEPTLEVLSDYGLQVVRTVPGSLALLAAARLKPVDPRSISAAVELGSTRGHLSLMTAGRVVHERALPDFNMQSLRGQVQEQLGVERDQAGYALSRFGLRDNPEGAVASETATLLSAAIEPLSEEIGMSFAYVSHLYPEAEIGQLLLSGGGANTAGLALALSESLELQATVLRPTGLMHGEHFGEACNDPALSTAVGAALCEEVPR